MYVSKKNFRQNKGPFFFNTTSQSPKKTALYFVGSGTLFSLPAGGSKDQEEGSKRLNDLIATFEEADGPKIMKEVIDSYFEIGKLYLWTICHSNILGRKCNGNVLELPKVGSKT